MSFLAFSLVPFVLLSALAAWQLVGYVRIVARWMLLGFKVLFWSSFALFLLMTYLRPEYAHIFCTYFFATYLYPCVAKLDRYVSTFTVVDTDFSPLNNAPETSLPVLVIVGTALFLIAVVGVYVCCNVHFTICCLFLLDSSLFPTF